MRKDDDNIVPEIYEYNIRPLITYLRDPETEEGRRISYQMRKFEQLIPGLVYGGNPQLGIYSHQPDSKILIKTPNRYLQREMDRFGNNFESRVYDLTILENEDDDIESGTVHRVTPQNLQKHPVRDTMYYCCNFVRYHAGRPLKIPITYANEEESSALKRDGFIVPINKYVECFIEDGVTIPEKIELECTGLQYKDVIRKDRLLVPDGVRLSDRVNKKGDNFIIGVVFGKSRGAIAKEEEAASGKKK
jgi:hypothetical protein